MNSFKASCSDQSDQSDCHHHVHSCIDKAAAAVAVVAAAAVEAGAEAAG